MTTETTNETRTEIAHTIREALHEHAGIADDAAPAPEQMRRTLDALHMLEAELTYTAAELRRIEQVVGMCSTPGHPWVPVSTIVAALAEEGVLPRPLVDLH